MKKILVLLFLLSSIYVHSTDLTITDENRNVHTYVLDDVNYTVSEDFIEVLYPDFSLTVENDYYDLIQRAYDDAIEFFNIDYDSSGTLVSVLREGNMYITLSQTDVSAWIQVKLDDFTFRLNWQTTEPYITFILEDLL